MAKIVLMCRSNKQTNIAYAFSAPLAFNSAALPLIDVPGGYLVELTIGICTQGRT